MARHFLKLKLALLVSAFRRGWQPALGLVTGVVVGLPLALMTSLGVAAAARTDAGPAVLVLLYALLAVSWVAAPVLLFGVDETLDPARLRLLPLSRRQLMVGLTVAGAVGIAPLATAIMLASGVAAARGPAGAAIALGAAATQLLICLWAGRALATALSAWLRSRRGRDVAAAAAMLMGLGLVAVAQVPNLVLGVTRQGSGAVGEVVALLDAAARLVTLTPPGWAGGAVAAAAEGRLGAAIGWLTLAVALAAALAWAWQAALERNLSTADTAPATRRADKPLVPPLLAWVPSQHLRAATAKEWRFLGRVPQLRIGIGMLAVFSTALVVAVAVAEPLSRPAIVYAPVALGALQAFQGLNGFAYDRGAVWLLVASGTDYRADLAGKGIAHGLATLGVLVPTMLVLAALTGGWEHLPSALGLALALQLAAYGAGAVSSVLAPHPMPEGAGNVLATTSGMGCSTFLLQLVGFAAQLVLLAPALGALLAAHLLAPALAPLAAVAAVVYGAGIWIVGVLVGAARLDARAPEIVTALSQDNGR